MAVGNALGSIGVNIGFILAFLLIATRPSVGDRRELLKNGFFLAFLLAALWIAGMLFGEISRAGEPY
jgi:Ca2+/Na+ antiporter